MSRRAAGAVRILALAGALAGPAAALAQEAVAVRTADHPGFGRIVFEFAAPTDYHLAVDGDRVLVVFEGAPAIGSPGAAPRNVRTIQGGQGAATLLLAPGARARPAVIGNRVVIDVLDPPGTPRPQAGRGQPVRPAAPGGTAAAGTAAPSGGAATPDGAAVTADASPPASWARDAPPAARLPASLAPAGTEGRGKEPAGPVAGGMVSEPALKQPDAAASSGAAAVASLGRKLPEAAGLPSSAPVQPAMGMAVDAGAAAAPQAAPPRIAPPLPASAAKPSMLVPLDSGVGAAALRRGGTVLIVFDSPAEVDEARLRRLDGFADASVRSGPAATVVQATLPSGAVALTREARGWRIGLAAPDMPGAAAAVASQAGADILLKLAQPGRVVAVTDPATGGALLVGTANPAAGPAGGLPSGLTAPGAAVLPTWAGVAVEPFSDDIALRAAPDGFLLAGAGAAGVPAAPAAAFTRRFDFPDQPVPALVQRLNAATASAAAAPPRARTPGRVAAAQAMLALGMGAEAQAVLALVAADDPSPPPEAAGLQGIAGLLAGRLDAAAGLDAPALDGSDDVALWRGVRDAMLGRSEAATRVLPGLMPLAMAYPVPLRDRVLPIVAETAVLAGPAAAASLPDLPRLGFARAMGLERQGRTEDALAAYDALADGTDQLDQVRAGAAAVELRLATGRLTPTQAAAAMTRLVATWRGDAREAATRMRAAELHGRAGAWRPALDLLRETEGLFPDARPAIQARMAEVFSGFLAGAESVAPLDVVALMADYADFVPPGADLADLLVDKLLALDLPARARTVLEQRVASAPPGPVRAGLGHRLAALQLEAGDAEAAGRTLAATEAAGLPERLVAERTLLRARVLAAQGDLAGAAAGLAGAGTPGADDLRAGLLEQAGDWRGASAVLDGMATRLLPADGPLPDKLADLVLREASDAVQAGDPGALRLLNSRYAARLPAPKADLFRLLTAAPLGGVGDLARNGREIALARAASSTGR